MHHKSSRKAADPRSAPAPGKDLTTAEEDARIQRVVLALTLDRHPAQLTLAELTREIAADAGDFSERDAVERGVRDLAAAGLLHRNGEFAIPTRAALRFDQLLRDRSGS